MNILFLNGSLNGKAGNSAKLIAVINNLFKEKKHSTDYVDLLNISPASMREKLTWADAFVFTTGTYWDSWGSPMQAFLETATEHEGSELFLGKPASVIVTMHSVGGKSILSRLQGVLSTFGCLIPPMSGMVHSLVGQLASESKSSFNDDFWSLDDLEVIVHNMDIAIMNKQNNNYRSWSCDKSDPKRIWIKE